MLKKLQPTNGLAANGLRTVCLACGKAVKYGEAVAQGWTYDPEGKPYEAYYCQPCMNEDKPTNDWKG